MTVYPRYISPERCCRIFDIYYFILYLFLIIKSGIFLKNNVKCNFILKYYQDFITTIYGNLNQSYYLSRANKNLEI